MDALLLGLIALITSAFTAAVGIGGGFMLLTILLDFLPASALIPVHAIVQLFSNVSRAAIGWRSVHWTLVKRHAAGALIGGIAGSLSIPFFPFEYLPLLLGGFVLFMTWSPHDPRKSRPHGTLFWVGSGQTFISFFLGATGPLSYPFLLRRQLDRHQIVTTHAVMMCSMHAAKLFGYGAQGFQIRDYWDVILAMSFGAVAGSYLGSKLRNSLPEKVFRHIAKVLLTLLALRMVANFFI